VRVCLSDRSYFERSEIEQIWTLLEADSFSSPQDRLRLLPQEHDFKIFSLEKKEKLKAR
jgi:hypothetical protein